MKSKKTKAYDIVYKCIPYCIVFVFLYYWLFTFGLFLFRKPLQKIMPAQASFHKVFLRQEWRLFEIPREYNRQMKLIIRDKQHPLQTDTIDIVQYLLAQKRKYAPFNNYQDALERLLNKAMNRLEDQLNENKRLLQKISPDKTMDFYVHEASKLAEMDTTHSANLQNIIAFGKYILSEEKINTSGKEYQLSLVHKYIPTQNATPLLSNNEQIIFITAYRNF